MHNASFVVTLTGIEYDSDALWNGELSPIQFLVRERADEKALNDTNPDSDSKPTPTVDFRIGSHCHKRAQLYHRLAHFKANLLIQIYVCIVSTTLFLYYIM